MEEAQKRTVAGEVSRNEVEQPTKTTVPTEDPDSMLQVANELELHRLRRVREFKSPARSLTAGPGGRPEKRVHGKVGQVDHPSKRHSLPQNAGVTQVARLALLNPGSLTLPLKTV